MKTNCIHTKNVYLDIIQLKYIKRFCEKSDLFQGVSDTDFARILYNDWYT